MTKYSNTVIIQERVYLVWYLESKYG